MLLHQTSYHSLIMDSQYISVKVSRENQTGEPGISDEPQHIKQGRIQIDLLNTMEIPYQIISSDDNEKLLTTLTIEGVDSGARVTIPVEITKEVITTSLTQGQTGVTLG